jgi:site-specific DNA-methyltransferase (adenine-specific)
MSTMDAESVDAVVTDPPAGISFMSKHWDDDHGGRDKWIADFAAIFRECYRVMKPGAHGLVWSLPRTSHWTATALEDAGFEVRDVLLHLFGSGFPKSHDVSKAIDKAAGAEREVVETRRVQRSSRSWECGTGMLAPGEQNFDRTAPATDAARTWAGWGTALKPAAEHWILVRKPIQGTVAACVLKHGTGALNIDATRIGTTVETWPATRSGGGGYMVKHRGDKGPTEATGAAPPGRWPANVILSHGECADGICAESCPVRMLDEQSGDTGANGGGVNRASRARQSGFGMTAGPSVECDNSGGASRFFYTSKASRADREGSTHPTMKPTDLMRWLCKLVTPPNGLILDPFCGSGSTGVAAVAEGFRFIGIEQDAEYVAIAERRIANVAPLFGEVSL